MWLGGSSPVGESFPPAHGGHSLKVIVFALAALAAVAGGPKEIANTAYRAPVAITAPLTMEVQ